MRAVQVNLKFHGSGYFEVPWGGKFGIILSLCTAQVHLKFHGGGNFDIILSSRTVQVHLKFHGGGNFDIILSSRTVQVNLKFHGIGIFIYRPCGQFEVPWGWER